jgi:hypothetical protein
VEEFHAPRIRLRRPAGRFAISSAGPKSDVLPETGGPVLAVATVGPGRPFPLKTLQFSGYQWEIRGTARRSCGFAENFYDPRTHGQIGWIPPSPHRQIGRGSSGPTRKSSSPKPGIWIVPVRRARCFSSGTGCGFALFTWDNFGPPREMDIEISRWGEPEDKNAQYVIQPYVVPANTVRFNAPAGALTYWIDWQPGRVSFRTARGSSRMPREDAVCRTCFHVRHSVSGNERIRT